jgi:crotonobetainyl-CoA:carnitine CoA-transferase CaiB-like acyl-CoA transferase
MERAEHLETKAPPASGPLAGLKVLDLSRFISGPLCATLLAEMGADVIKVERPGGEDARQLGSAINGLSIYTLNYNRNKRAITLNTRSPQGRALLERLVGWADVVVENYRPGTMEEMGFGYERLEQIKPGVVLTSVSGFGQTGPYRERALFDFLAQAMSGLMSMNGRPEDPPLLTGIFIADCVAALYAAFGTVVALYERKASGKGQVVDIALLDSIFSCMGAAVPAYLMLGEMPIRSGPHDGVPDPGRRSAPDRRRNEPHLCAARRSHGPPRPTHRPALLHDRCPHRARRRDRGDRGCLGGRSRRRGCLRDPG